MKLYLAGPEVFFPDPIEEGERLKAICKDHGFEGIFPLDGALNIEDLDHHEIAHAIFDANVLKIDQTDGMIANMTPFRGPGMDGGTAFEIGYAYAKGIPIIGWSEDDRDYLARVRAYFDGRLTNDPRCRDPDGLEVEDFGQPDNLMLSSAVMDIVSSFEAAVRLMHRVKSESAS